MFKKYSILCCLICILAVPFSYSHVIFSEFFPNTGPTNIWISLPSPYSDTVFSVYNAGSPGKDGDGYVGSVADTDLSYFGIAAVWAGDSTLSDYFIEAWMYCPVTTWGGVAQQPFIMGRVNPYSSGLYCRMKVNLNTPASFSWQSYNGSWNIITLYPAGFSWPTEDGWHKVKMKFAADTIWCWFDDHLLSNDASSTEGNPFTDSLFAPGGELAVGAWGIGMLNYNPTGVLSGATTFIDDYVVRSDETIEVGPSGIRLAPSETYTFVGSGGIGPYLFTCDNPAIGSINSTTGLFLAVNTGTCNITATDYFGYTGSVLVLVSATDAPIISDEITTIQRRESFSELFE